MAGYPEEAAQLLPGVQEDHERESEDSVSTASTTSLVFERIGERLDAEDEKRLNGNGRKKMVTPKFPPSQEPLAYVDDEHAQQLLEDEEKDDYDVENEPYMNSTSAKKVEKSFRRLMLILGTIFIGAWVVALVIFLGKQAYGHPSTIPHDPDATTSKGTGKEVTLDQVMSGQWRAIRHGISWIEGENGEDGLLLEQGANGKDYLVVEDIRAAESEEAAAGTKTLMKQQVFIVGGKSYSPSKVFPSKDLKKVLIATDYNSNWRHSFYARYFIFDVETQIAEALDPAAPEDYIQLARWSPQSDAIVFTRENNLFLRKLSSKKVIQITTDGGVNLFYGIPDWVYEEEVFAGNSATWWADDGKYIAFLRTNETEVPEYPIQ